MSAGSGGADRHGSERLFVAWEPDGATSAALARCACDWRDRAPAIGLRWQDGTQLHLTLRFLGATGAQQRAGVERQIAALAARFTPCLAQSAALEAWPSPLVPRVLVLALAADPVLVELAGALETLARAAGYAAETRHFRPHFTLARAAPGTTPESPPPLPPAITCRIDALSLVRSTPGPSGSRYDVLSRWLLAAP